VTEQVPPIRGLEARAETPFRFIGQEQFEQEFRAQFLEQNPPERIAAEQDLYIRLGLLPEDADLEALVLSLYGSQVAAYYDTRTKAFTVVQRENFEFGVDDEVIVAHEYDHALQDQHFDLEATEITDPGEGDRALAALGLIEGDATALMLDWAQTHLEFEELIALLSTSLSPADQALLDSMPPILRRQLEFPYLDGFAFITALRLEGDWAAVDAAFADRPKSTEQILHPEKYTTREEPIVVEIGDLASRMGNGWRESYRQTMGELLTGVFVADGASGGPQIPGLPSTQPNAEAAAGWGGDRVVSLDGPDGVWAVYWEMRWDTDVDADEFESAAEAAMADLATPHIIMVVAASGPGAPPRSIALLIASDTASLDLLSEALASR
ncbi:MAG TPA: hypothetical protein VGP30_08335, partial [Candidatus Limnocylindrales bacterium]|nr:hypothetical protein [Candidatus Limnocylindrales bacterium]